MTGGAANVLFGRCHPDSLHPDLDWLEEQLKQPSPPKMVVLVNPNNPTGAVNLQPDMCSLLGFVPMATAAILDHSSSQAWRSLFPCSFTH